MKRSARASSICSTGPGLGMRMAMELAPAWPGLDWGRCLLMKWLRACISSSLSLSLDIGLLLKLNEYLKRQREREKNQSNETKWNQTKWNFCHGAIWRYKRCFSIESICRQKLFKFSNRHMCVQWVGQAGRGWRGNQKKNHIESSAPSTSTSTSAAPTPSSSFAFSWACHRFLDMRHNCRWYCQQRHQVQWSATRRRSSSRKKYASRNVNELHCECHCSHSLSLSDPLFFQRI